MVTTNLAHSGAERGENPDEQVDEDVGIWDTAKRLEIHKSDGATLFGGHLLDHSQQGRLSYASPTKDELVTSSVHKLDDSGPRRDEPLDGSLMCPCCLL